MSSKKKNMRDAGERPAPYKDNRPKVYIVGGGFEYIRLMYKLGCDGAKGVEDADVILFTGGEDVDPHLYGEVPLAKTHYSKLRDEREQKIFDRALELGIPMVGICRGGQFLNVMNKGKMWQHVSCHTRNHLMRIEVPPFNKGKRRTIEVTSTHHQMMIPTDEAIILGTAMEALEKDCVGYTKIGKDENDPDTEVVLYEDTHCLCFQPHPEFNHAPAECVDFFEECLDAYIYPHIPEKMVKEIIKQSDIQVR